MKGHERGGSPTLSNFGQAPLDLLLLDVSAYAHMPPLGLLYIASYVNSLGMRCRIKLLQGERGGYSKKYLYKLLDNTRPFAVGLPATAECMEDVSRYCRWIREHTSARIMVGGPEATANPEYVLECTGADAVVIGDGEVKAARLLQAWKAGTIPTDISGLMWRSNGQRFQNDDPSLGINIDDLPFPDFDTILGAPYTTLSILTGRGCPYQCTFCFEGRNSNFRSRNLNLVIKELKQTLARKPNVVAFIDDTFTLNKRSVRAICDVMKERFDGPWFCEGRVGMLIKHPEIIDMLADAGLQRIQLGLESGSQRVLDAYKKETTPDQILEVFHHCHKAGITSVIGNFIVGGAVEDNETCNETLQIAKELIRQNPGSAELLTCYLYPYKGTAVEERPADFGLEYLEDLPVFNAASRVACINHTDALSRGEISQFREILTTVIQSAMLKEIDRLPPEKIHIHMINARDYGIQSEWYLTFLQCKPLALFAMFQSQYNGYTWQEIAGKNNWLDYCPLRIGYNQLHVNGDTLSVMARREKRVALTGLTRRLYEMSSGKLSLREMLPFLREGAATGERAFLQQIRKCSERMARDFLCIYMEL
jgi:radical SAM superfamily enzyme YgiQ (UPF0313 family)